MIFKKFRVQNFQCIVDSEEIPLDPQLTIFVGANESGKTALLKALYHFKRGLNFSISDLTELTEIRSRLEAKEIQPEDIPIVTVWLTLEPSDWVKLGFQGPPPRVGDVEVSKYFDNGYRVRVYKRRSPAPEIITETGAERVGNFIDGVIRNTENVYCGKVKDWQGDYWHVWLEREEEEDESENLVLFQESAPDIWPNLERGVELQVTRVSEQKFRNNRALNAGFKYDTSSIIETLRELKRRCSAGQDINAALEVLRSEILQIPGGHPLGVFVDSTIVGKIRQLIEERDGREITGESGRVEGAEEGEQEVIELGEPSDLLDILPEIRYYPTLPGIADSASLIGLSGKEDLTEGERLLDALLRQGGLVPAHLSSPDRVLQIRKQAECSTKLTKRLSYHWFEKDLQLGVLKDGEQVELWVRSPGMEYLPSRRSKGLQSYLSLAGVLAELSLIEDRDVIALLDDPGVFIHPIAQERILPLLDSQPFPIMMATHLPYMIDPGRIERIRVVARDDRGRTFIENDWERAGRLLEPVWGSVATRYIAPEWLIVEGAADARAFERISRACASVGDTCLPQGLCVVPGGGNQIRYLVRQFLKRGVRMIVVVDHDGGGLTELRAIRKVSAELNCAALLETYSLGDLISPRPQGDYRLENLFDSRAEWTRATGIREPKELNFESDTIERFRPIFSGIGGAYSRLASSRSSLENGSP